jgi:hypothetical protein
MEGMARRALQLKARGVQASMLTLTSTRRFLSAPAVFVWYLVPTRNPHVLALCSVQPVSDTASQSGHYECLGSRA